MEEKKKTISYLQRELRRSVSKEDNAPFFMCVSYFCFVLFHLPRFVRSLLRRFFLRVRDKMLIKTCYSRHARSGLAERRVK